MNIEDRSGLDYYYYRLKTSAELHREECQAPASEFEELKLPTLSSQMKCFSNNVNNEEYAIVL